MESEEVTPPETEAPQTESLSILVAEEPIPLEAPTTILVQIVVIETGGEPVSLSSPQLPVFAQLSGTVLRLSPGYGDAGTHEIPLTATAGDRTTSTTLRLAITRKNTPPMWLPAPEVINSRPPALTATVCDPEGDDITLEAKVVPQDRPDLQEVSFVQTISFKQVFPLPYYNDKSCAKFTIPLSGLPPGVTYKTIVRTYDSLGAQGIYGWVTLSYGKFTT